MGYVTGTDGSAGLTDDPDDPALRKIQSSGMQEKYLILSDEERAKGFVRPVRRSYTHLQCGTSTHMGLALCETYARNPDFYGGTFCTGCGTHFPLLASGKTTKVKPLVKQPEIGHAFVWDEDGEGVGS